MNLGRLNPDGTLDTSFNAEANYGVSAIAVQPDGKIVVGGSFTTVPGQSRSFIGRIDGNGNIDASFTPGADGGVSRLTVQADGGILVGGGFATLGGQTRRYLGRLNADGTPDMKFNPGADFPYINSLAVQTDGNILGRRMVQHSGWTGLS